MGERYIDTLQLYDDRNRGSSQLNNLKQFYNTLKCHISSTV